MVEIVDRFGDGFSAELDENVALDSACRLIGALARLRGYKAP
jgi:hypothetical protein